MIVGSHSFVDPAFGYFNPECRANVLDTLREGFCRNYQVVETIQAIYMVKLRPDKFWWISIVQVDDFLAKTQSTQRYYLEALKVGAGCEPIER